MKKWFKIEFILLAGIFALLLCIKEFMTLNLEWFVDLLRSSQEFVKSVLGTLAFIEIVVKTGLCGLAFFKFILYLRKKPKLFLDWTLTLVWLIIFLLFIYAIFGKYFGS